ncbi:hypothetical protein [Microvirga rosea]|uniref:hypothetical protein n=1 Tax=Microvirga rosea TaxID=2715425 RepID=UPI001D09BD59|nr:hypothetical protein [Microvirga rosea]MCB8821486.1 hypothetical protein [Microvirga rosea]
MGPTLHEVASQPDQAPSTGQSPLLARVRTVLTGLDLDCRCRSKVDAALERFEALETRRQLRGLILDAKHQADRIAALLELVGELDTISMDEPDLSVFREIALLFEDIRAAAARGAEDMIGAGNLERQDPNRARKP